MPRLPDHLIRKLQEAYREGFGRDISFEEATALGEALVDFFAEALDEPTSTLHP